MLVCAVASIPIFQEDREALFKRKPLRPIPRVKVDILNCCILRCHLLKISQSSDYDKSHIELFKMIPPSNQDISKLKSIWQENPKQQSLLDEDSAITLGMIFSTVDHLNAAEEIFNRLHHNSSQHQSLGVLARKISLIYKKLKNNTKTQQYAKYADALITGSI